MDNSAHAAPRLDAPARHANVDPQLHARWPLWQRLGFRFFFIYLLLQIAPWNWFNRIPGVITVTRYWYQAVDWLVRTANTYVFHVRETLVPVNGSGDTSWAYTQLLLYLSLAGIGCLIWSVLDRDREAYPRLGYWLRTVVRYYIATFALSYGIIKLFALQMSFPTLSQLSTPLGDFLPMRFSWLFIGYSVKYQIFSGLMETVAGVLLLFRRTVTLGLLAATGAFLNVVMINMSYDVPVKLFASHLLFACIFLLLWDAKRLFHFLVLNKPTGANSAYEPYFTSAWLRWGARGLKLVLVVLILIFPFRDGWRRYRSIASDRTAVVEPFDIGIYNVRTFTRNGDTIPPGAPEAMRWRDVIFDSRTSGSVGTTDSLFWQRYRRGYFRFRANPEEQTAVVWKNNAAFDSTYLFTMRYERPDTSTILLWADIGKDSVYVELARDNRHFQLTERQFHWLSEYNR
jgi:hypothetical protein